MGEHLVLSLIATGLTVDGEVDMILAVQIKAEGIVAGEEEAAVVVVAAHGINDKILLPYCRHLVSVCH